MKLDFGICLIFFEWYQSISGANYNNLSDRGVLSVIGRRFLEHSIAGFFIYWTIDVKGYYNGYSIYYGGLVLLPGFP